MAGTAVRGRLTWQIGTVTDVVEETRRARTIVLELPDWPGHAAGQHVDIRLTAEDGYQAQRSYSIASAPEDGHVALTVELLDDGEVSPYLVEELRVGDQVELRGPIGGYFVWTASLGGPVQLIAGGSGVVPLRAMLRHDAAAEAIVPIRLLYSARSLDDVIYRDELADYAGQQGLDVQYALTREWPADWRGYHRRIDGDMLAEAAWSPADHPLAYICGPSGFVEAIAGAMVAQGHDPARIRTERFGASGAAR
jgi:ferredoxin-NADP reductase